MKIIQAINRIDALKRNTYSQPEKVEWLSRVDWMVKKHIIDTHEGAEKVSFNGYDDLTDLQTELLVPAPHEEMYLRWLEAMIDYYNSEDDRYNNAIMLFNNAYEGYKKHYTRTHMPKSNGSRFVF